MSPTLAVKIDDQKFFQIQEAAKKLGVSRQTLQRWFREGKATDVARDHRGWRLFTQSDIDRLKNEIRRDACSSRQGDS
jgi:excisionase family DNA binding protein